MKPMHPQAVPLLDVDEDFDDLEQIIAESEQTRAANAELKAKHKRIAQLAKNKSGDRELEYNDLVAYVRKFEEGLIWKNVSAIALFNVQTCSLCGEKHSFFVGWMTEQRHKRDPNTRRLIRGKPIEMLPERVEENNYGPTEMCNNCVECVLAINAAVSGVPHE